MKILHTGDIHFGTNTYGRIDPATGLNTRLLDFRRCFKFMVERGLKEDIDVFLFCGDAYRTATPTPTQQKAFAECLKPLADAGIPIVMVTGNHDHPISFGKASSIDIFGYLTGNVQVFRKPTATLIPTSSGTLQLLAMPWPVRSLLLLGEDSRKMSPEALCEAIQQKYTEIIQAEAAKLDPALPTVLAGHFSVVGCIPGGSESSSLMLREPIFSPAELSVPPIDYVALGHIHHFQNCATDPEATPVVYSSSIERVTFNERNSRKGFVLVHISGNPKRTTFKFVETPARRFVQLDINAVDSTDPTNTIVKAIAREDIGGSIVRVRFRIQEAQRPSIDMGKIRAALKPAFAIASIERTWDPVERKRDTKVTSESTLVEALGSYIDQRSSLSGVKNALMDKALELEAAVVAAQGAKD